LDPKIFSAKKTGQIIPISGALALTHAFVPNPLPAEWEWPERLWPLLLEAHTALAKLEGIGKYLPNPRLVIRPLQNREAQLSSKLEGTITDPQQQALFQVEPKYPTSKNDPANAYREVFNYARALRLQLESEEELPLSLRLIRQLHGVLMDGVRGAEQNPGQFRRVQNQIGNPATYVPPPIHHLKDCLDAFEKYLHTEHRFNSLVEAFMVHYQFEAIHPFGDGNGRVGRLFLALTIAEWCRLSNQWLYMSAYFERNKDLYNSLMLRVSTYGDWESWIEFCLKGVVEEASNTQHRCDQLLLLHRAFHETVKRIRGSIRLASIIDSLFDTPIIVALKLVEKHKVTYPTARADLKKLENADILQVLPEASHITYYCPEIFRITYSD
jgi:Fic family protein